MEAFDHITFNTGDFRRSPRSEVPQAAIDAFRPIVATGDGAIPGMSDWFLHVFPKGLVGGPRDGAAFFQIAGEPGECERPVAMCFACWRPEESRSTWEQAVRAYRVHGVLLRRVGFWREPPPGPAPGSWVAVILTVVGPLMRAAGNLAPADMMAFGSIPRCMFWALAEAPPPDHPGMTG